MFHGSIVSVFLLLPICVLLFVNDKEKDTVEPRSNDLRYNDIPGITTNICLPSKSYSKMYGAEPWYNDLRYNDIPGLMMGVSLTERKIFRL